MLTVYVHYLYDTSVIGDVDFCPVIYILSDMVDNLKSEGGGGGV